MPKRNEVFITAAIPRELRKELAAHSQVTGLKLKAIITNFLYDGLKQYSEYVAAKAAPSQPTAEKETHETR